MLSARYLIATTASLATAVLISGCTTPIAGRPTMSPVVTNSAGRPFLDIDPCDSIPADVFAGQNINPMVAGNAAHSAAAGDEIRICFHRSIDRRHVIGIVVSNEKFGHPEISISDSNGLTVRGRRAIGFTILDSGATDVESCEIDVAATTGRFGVQMVAHVSPHGESFRPHSDCLSAANYYADIFAPYFPL